ncbi:MAG: hypothetical protein DHS20C04_00390 [Hyphococcus sp.]|nr:MAG: hypothetical protein DHS20C04_00390 [Marinicaulis sp.]
MRGIRGTICLRRGAGQIAHMALPKHALKTTAQKLVNAPAGVSPGALFEYCNDLKGYLGQGEENGALA